MGRGLSGRGRLPVRPGATLAAAAPPPVAVFPLGVVDTSGEPPNPQWPERIATDTHGSHRYRAVEVAPPDPTGTPIHQCVACWRDPARKAGAEMAAIAVVQKMLRLISSLHIWLVDVESGQPLRQGAVSLRGDTEKAWRRAVDFLLRHGILDPNPAHPMLASPFPAGG